MRLINFGPGEAADRLSILVLKILHANGSPIDHFEKERAALLVMVKGRNSLARWFEYYIELAAVNAEVWRLNDELRSLGEVEDFVSAGKTAIEQQQLNDRRAQLIELINQQTGEHLGPEKL
ncbi:MAG: hypothetical protein KGL39_57010 [Patescibacteria group bacterium]|nr:hypothetical protein [Patescibacteria group bacterium]